MKEKIKIEKIYDTDGCIDGYKLGNWYLMKVYYWGYSNDYYWVINNGDWIESGYENKYVHGKTIIPQNCKNGKELLKKLYLEKTKLETMEVYMSQNHSYKDADRITIDYNDEDECFYGWMFKNNEHIGEYTCEDYDEIVSFFSHLHVLWW